MAGAAGYVLKEINGTDLVPAIRQVADGESLIDPALTARVLERVRNGPSTAPELAELTEQELKLLALHRRGPDQPADRRADVPRREDGEELRVQHPLEARPRASHPGRGARRQAARPDTGRSYITGQCSGTRQTNVVPRARARSAPGRRRAPTRGAARCAARSRPGPAGARRRRRSRSAGPRGRRPRARPRLFGERVPGDVGQRLAQHRQQLLADGRARRCRPGRSCAPSARSRAPARTR